MTDYSIFGGSLRSTLEFPFLAERPHGAPTWTLHVCPPEPLPADAVMLGTDAVDASVSVRLHRSAAGWHLVYDDTGRFDIDPAGRHLIWRSPENASSDNARLDIIGRVLAMALHAGGDLCLHASAVSVGSEAIAFLGAKGFGKSTLAWALVRAGAKLITDDTLRVQLGSPPLAYPGVHELRLRSDAAHELPPAPREARVSGDRLVVGELPPVRRQDVPVCLSTLYLLAPVAGHPSWSGVSASALPPVLAALSLVRHAKIAPLLTGAEAGRLLDRVVSLARRVSVRLLEVPRDFARLDDVVADLVGRHSEAAGAPAA